MTQYKSLSKSGQNTPDSRHQFANVSELANRLATLWDLLTGRQISSLAAGMLAVCESCLPTLSKLRASVSGLKADVSGLKANLKQ